MSCWFLLVLCFIEIPIINANSIDPDHTPRFAASDLGLHCLPVTILGVSRLKWLNMGPEKKYHGTGSSREYLDLCSHLYSRSHRGLRRVYKIYSDEAGGEI